MARETSVVTPERFQQGFSYSDYIDQIKVNKARFEEFYKFQVKPEDAKDLKELASRWRPELSAGFRKKACHRALDDILESIEELRYYRDHFLRIEIEDSK